ncbi:hypothetical protein GH714_025009 [Hevea brasiliensis]|uniref:Uncharacterized protein n=1 Tax=Hevea brasiliensis TaxID=3981 RepID=A0A6A6NIV4_HEVBR|nr:hypothetical protein GH714_025009 [Hevea brasiliensis]
MPHGARTPDNVVSKQAPDDPNHAKCSNGTGVGRVPMVTRVLLESGGGECQASMGQSWYASGEQHDESWQRHFRGCLRAEVVVSWSYCQNRKGTKEQLKLIDVVIEVRDARIPLSTTHPQVKFQLKIAFNTNVVRFIQKFTIHLFNGDTHQAAFRISSDFRKGKFGWVALETGEAPRGRKLPVILKPMNQM